VHILEYGENEFFGGKAEGLKKVLKSFVSILSIFTCKKILESFRYNECNYEIQDKKMQTLNLKIDDTFFPHFKAILESFIKDKKIEIIDNLQPHNFIVSSIEEVQKRVLEAENELSLSQEEYQTQMDTFFKDELGIKR